MPFRLSRLLAVVLSVQLACPAVLRAESKPTLIVPPMGEGSNDKARSALISSLRDTGRVNVVEADAVDRYVKDRTAAPATAGKPASEEPEAAATLRKGIAAFKALQIDASVDLFSKAKRAFRASLADEGAFDGMRASQFFLARAYLAKKDTARAQEELLQAVVLDPERNTRKLSEKLYSTELRKLFDQARRGVERKDHGDLDIDTKPGGAVVYVDGKSVGAAPARVDGLPVGEHYVRVAAEGREAYFAPHVIVAGQNRVAVELKAPEKIDPARYFAPVKDASEIEHRRAAFLDEMGLALGAEIFVFVAPEQGAVRAQLYDQRSQDVSAELSGTSPAGLASRLAALVGRDGYVVTAQAAEKPEAPVVAAPREIPGELQPGPSTPLSEQAERPLPEQSLVKSRGWYRNPWIWAAIGGGLLLVAGGTVIIVKTQGGSKTSRLTIAVPGK